MPEYRIRDWGSIQIQWMKAWDGSFLVDSKYVDDFLKEYPDAVLVEETTQKDVS